ncbi:MAG: cardiolipin synthase [Gemmatimonadota bacterium]
MLDAYLVGGWVLGIVLIPVVARERRLTSALSWLAVIFALPWLGALLYLLFAEHRPTRRALRHRSIVASTRTRERLRFQEPFVFAPPPDVAQLGALIRRLGGFAALEGNRVDVMQGDRASVTRLIEDIDSAHHHVHLLFYLIEPDGTGRSVADALRRAAARGVSCRVLADAIGSHRFHRHLAPELREAGVEVRKVLSLPFLARKLRPLDMRNHRKLVIVDGRVAYTGSMNLMDADAPSTREKGQPWRELTVRLSGPAVLQLQVVFEEDWRHNTGKPLPATGLFPTPVSRGAAPVQVVPSGPNERADVIHALVVAAISGARERIVITTPYLIPDEPTRVALELAALRGVDVRLVVPRKSDARIVDMASRSHIRDLLAHGVHIHEHHTGFLHAKTLTVDRTVAMIGSANFDRRSFHLNFELNLLLYGQEIVEHVSTLQDRYLADCHPVPARRSELLPRGRRVLEDVARLLSPLF